MFLTNLGISTSAKDKSGSMAKTTSAETPAEKNIQMRGLKLKSISSKSAKFQVFPKGLIQLKALLLSKK